MSKSAVAKAKDPAVELILCIFLGMFGVHRFYSRKYGTAILYLFTGGLFCIGWVVDLILIVCRYLNGRKFAPSDLPQSSVTSTENVSASKTTDEVANTIVRAMRQSASKPTAHSLPVFNLDFIRDCKKCFIAFDVETTGFDPATDRIIEISAVRFENFKAVASFSTLVNPNMHIPSAASKVNHIYDKDVADAPDELQAIPAFCNFIGQATLDGNVPLVAHNATFDIKFLLHALSYCGIMADLSFQDTLYMSRESALGLENNKLGTVANYFGIEQKGAHRAEDDARVCGEVFIHLLSEKEAKLNRLISELSEDEIQLCKWLKYIFEEADLNTQFLTFHSGTYLTCGCVYNALKFKSRARKPYVLIEKGYPIPDNIEITAASKSEGEKYVRAVYHTVGDLEPLKPYFIERYRETFEMAEKYFTASDRNLKEAARNVNNQISI